VLAIAGLLVVAGIAAAATPQPTTLKQLPEPVRSLAQDGGMLAWLASDKTKCNTVRIMGNGKTYVLPHPANGSMTCHWNLSNGPEQLAVASGVPAALWTLHEGGSDFVMTAQVGGKEIDVDRLAHETDGTGWWLGGTTGGGTTLAYSSVDVEYVNPLACGSGGSCKKKIAGGGIYLVAAGEKTLLHGSGPALGLAVDNGRIAYIRAADVAKGGKPASSPDVPVQVVDASDGAVISRAKPVGVPLAVGLSPHVLAVLSRNGYNLRLTWYDPATGHKLGGIGVPVQTAPELAVNDQFVVYRFGRYLRALAVAKNHIHVLGKTGPAYLGLSLDQGRLVWAENTPSSGRIRALFLR
jgi:hypothetical protein